MSEERTIHVSARALELVKQIKGYEFRTTKRSFNEFALPSQEADRLTMLSMADAMRANRLDRAKE